MSELDKMFQKAQPTETDRTKPDYEAEDRELEQAIGDIWDIALEFGLDPFPTHFEVVPPKIINELGSYGIPGRFSHWTHGQQYRQLKTTYDYGLSKIYELVINSNPSLAFLLENNPPIENKFVAAHVLGHTDFFKNNHMFAPTRRNMPEIAALHNARMKSYEQSEGRLQVEQLLDAVLAIEEHVDPYAPDRPARSDEIANWKQMALDKSRPKAVKQDRFDEIFNQSEKPVSLEAKMGRVALQMPPEPDRDLLGFIRNHAPHLEDWQRDVVDMVRDESLYFYPQRRTKIMNEGWAAYWHKRIMREVGDRNLISDSDNEAWWKVHSGVVQPNPRQLNPYYLGMKMYEYIEDYYNGNLTEDEINWLKKEGKTVYPKFEGDLKDSPAAPRLREAMMYNDDQSFIRNHFDKIVADRMNLYVYEKQKSTMYGPERDVIKSTGWKDIRDVLVNSKVNCGNPLIEVIDGNYNDTHDLYLRHSFDGRTLDPDYITKTLPYIYYLWQRPVYLETTEASSSKVVVHSFDGKTMSKKG